MSKVKLQTWLVPKLRNISRMWPEKSQAINAAKEQIQIGFYKNGKPEYKTLFKCAHCGNLFVREEVHVDHINSVVSTDGFTTWDDFLTRLFCEVDGLQVLCIEDHKTKSYLENQLRKEQRKLKKRLDK